MTIGVIQAQLQEQLQERILADLQEQLQDAIQVHQANRDGGSTAESVAFDAGRVDGLKHAIEIVEQAV